MVPLATPTTHKAHALVRDMNSYDSSEAQTFNPLQVIPVYKDPFSTTRSPEAIQP